MNVSALLTSLGLSEKESRTYLAVLELGRSTVKPIADRAHIKRTSIYNFIGHLVELGLISKMVIRGRRHFQAINPTRLMDLERARMQKLEEALPGLNSLFNLTNSKARIHFYEKPREVGNIVKEEIYCKREALYIWPGRDIMEMIGGVAFMTEVDRARIKNGVSIRTIRFRHKDIIFNTSAHGAKYKRELRFAPPHFNFSMGVGIYDTGKVGFFSSKKEGFGILIESKELEELIRALYELLWKSCMPAKEGEG